jgi:hypothetical protein
VKTAKEWFDKITESEGRSKFRGEVCILSPDEINAIQTDAFRAGMTIAADMCIDCDSGVLGAREAIITARDAITTLL